MCKVKTGKRILNSQDVQNLVTGIILRQMCSFQRDELLEAVEHYMKGSPIQDDHKQIKEIIDRTLMTCISNDWLFYKRGCFFPRQSMNVPPQKVG